MSCSKNMVTKAITIEPRTQFSGEIDSIKMYGAFIKGYVDLVGKYEEVIGLIEEGCLRISSPMPKINDVYYTFKPNLKLGIEDTVKIKKFKKIRYLPMDIAQGVLSRGEYSMDDVIDSINNGGNFANRIEIPGVTVGRLNSAGNIYYKDAVDFHYENENKIVPSKLWLLLNLAEEIENDVKAIFRYLGDMGISKRRSSGFGHFYVSEFKDIDIENKSKLRMFLSKYIPSREETMSFPFEKSRYGIELISGYEREGSPIGVVRAVTEGSIFPAFGSKVLGRVIRFGSGNRYSLVGVPVIL